ncbi:MAG: hypothetical protein Q4G28_08930 [Neisseria sp.]|nr:hypothetical protein [Neisseria sp.]
MRIIPVSALSACALALALSACGGEKAAEPAAADTPASAVVQAASDAPAADVAASSMATASDGGNEVQQSGPIASFTAFGSHPEGWRAVLRGNAEESGNRLMLEGENLPAGEIETTRSAYAKGVEFSGSAGETAVGLNIRSQDCTDEQGNRYDFTATLDYGSKTFRGCAEAGMVAHAPT